MAGLLPEKVRTRKGKRGPDQAIYFALMKEWPILKRLLSEQKLSALGCIDHDKFYDALKLARYGQAAHLPRLLFTLSLEIWLATVHERLSRPSLSLLCS